MVKRCQRSNATQSDAMVARHCIMSNVTVEEEENEEVEEEASKDETEIQVKHPINSSGKAGKVVAPTPSRTHSLMAMACCQQPSIISFSNARVVSASKPPANWMAGVCRFSGGGGGVGVGAVTGGVCVLVLYVSLLIALLELGGGFCGAVGLPLLTANTERSDDELWTGRRLFLRWMPSFSLLQVSEQRVTVHLDGNGRPEEMEILKVSFSGCSNGLKT
ncbi:hypothetical protein Leryth_002755 [Lithospermum erythrorhizon]|nr:hypothetical protein Leryth_002755 [Lithospermum erythrorhizon]